jgi:hypothetical protein
MKKVMKKISRETDGVYFLKILLYFILGMIWVKYNGWVVFPLGLVVGIIFTHNDHFAIDRKVEYAVLIVSALIGLSTGGVIFIAL